MIPGEEHNAPSVALTSPAVTAAVRSRLFVASVVKSLNHGSDAVVSGIRREH
jgi:hypothetical protein